MTFSRFRSFIGHFSRFESTHESTWILQVPDLQVQVTVQVDSYRSQSRVQFLSNLQVQIQVTCRSTYVQLYSVSIRGVRVVCEGVGRC